MHGLVWIALALAVVWLVGVTVFKIVGFAIHLALIAAAVLFIAWAFRRVMSGRARAHT